MATKLSTRDLINAWNTHSADKVIEFYAENAELETPESAQLLRGKDAIRENVQGWMKAFPDVTGDIEMEANTGETVALLVHFSGTNRGEIVLGPGQTLPATNKKVEMPVGIFATLDSNGKIVKERDVFDLVSYAQQLGIPLDQLAQSTPTRGATTGRTR